MFGSKAIHGELEAGMLRHFFQGTLGYVGLHVHQPFIAYHVPYVDDQKRAEMLGELHSCVTRLETRQIIPMPSLDDYDSTFKPLP
jgi:NAD(P)H dehydrogenase (quinone)